MVGPEAGVVSTFIVLFLPTSSLAPTVTESASDQELLGRTELGFVRPVKTTRVHNLGKKQHRVTICLYFVYFYVDLGDGQVYFDRN